LSSLLAQKSFNSAGREKERKPPDGPFPQTVSWLRSCDSSMGWFGTAGLHPAFMATVSPATSNLIIGSSHKVQ